MYRETVLGTTIFPGMPLVGSEDNLDVDGEVKFAYWEGARSVSSGRKARPFRSSQCVKPCVYPGPCSEIYGLARA